MSATYCVCAILLLSTVLLSSSTVFSSPTTCLPGWIWSPTMHKYYRVIFEMVDWDTADSRCRELGSKSHLVAVNDATEHQAIITILASLNPHFSRICDGPRVLWPGGYGGFWTSGQRLDRKNCATPWVWKPYAGESLPVTIADWNPGEPNCGSGTEACLQYGDGRTNFKWNDIWCNFPLCPLCELEI